MTSKTYQWPTLTAQGGPFDLDDHAAFEAWAEHKLSGFGAFQLDPVVEINDPEAVTDAEAAALLSRLRQANMVLYAWNTPRPDELASKRGVVALGRQFGLSRLDNNLHADADALTALSVSAGGDRARYIPYTNRSINWHCDGYYNAYEDQIRAMVLHCVRPASSGGQNALFDPEMAYLLLRQDSPDHIRALMAPDAMAIPANTDEGTEIRPLTRGPVFTVNQTDGTLHMRYSARKRNILWAEDAATQAAVSALEGVLADRSRFILRHQMEAGQGLLCNNVLHTRTAFEDSGRNPGRLMLRGRYLDRIQYPGERS